MDTVRPSRALRLALASTWTSIATFTALLSHVIAGGTMPGWLGIVVPWLLSFVVCVNFVGRKLPLLRLSFAVLISQLMFHTLFVIGAEPTAGFVVSPSGHTSHDQLTPVGPSDPVTAMTHADATMWIWHAIAAVITITALYRGARALAHVQSIAREVGAWVRRISASAVTMLTATLAPAALPPVVYLPIGEIDEPFLVSVGRRGPPSPRHA